MDFQVVPQPFIIPLFLHLFIPFFLHSYISLFLHHLFLHPFIPSFLYSFKFIHSSLHPFKFSHSSLHPFIPPSLHSFNLSLLYPFKLIHSFHHSSPLISRHPMCGTVSLSAGTTSSSRSTSTPEGYGKISIFLQNVK